LALKCFSQGPITLQSHPRDVTLTHKFSSANLPVFYKKAHENPHLMISWLTL